MEVNPMSQCHCMYASGTDCGKVLTTLPELAAISACLCGALFCCFAVCCVSSCINCCVEQSPVVPYSDHTPQSCSQESIPMSDILVDAVVVSDAAVCVDIHAFPTRPAWHAHNTSTPPLLYATPVWSMEGNGIVTEIVPIV